MPCGLNAEHCKTRSTLDGFLRFNNVVICNLCKRACIRACIGELNKDHERSREGWRGEGEKIYVAVPLAKR